MLANKFLVGCDPEFVIIGNNKLPIEVPGYESRFGCDGGNECTAEIRPKPSRKVLSLVENIKKAFSLKRANKYLKYTWRAGGFYKNCSLGGHIHFGTDYGTDAKIALDDWTKQLLASKVLSNKEFLKRQRSCGYGRFGDIRGNDSFSHFEYRTMISWLHDPMVAHIVLTGAKLCVVDPSQAMDALSKRSPIKALMEAFLPDEDAIYSLEEVLRGGVRPLQGLPLMDFKEAWGLKTQLSGG